MSSTNTVAGVDATYTPAQLMDIPDYFEYVPPVCPLTAADMDAYEAQVLGSNTFPIDLDGFQHKYIDTLPAQGRKAYFYSQTSSSTEEKPNNDDDYEGLSEEERRHKVHKENNEIYIRYERLKMNVYTVTAKTSSLKSLNSAQQPVKKWVAPASPAHKNKAQQDTTATLARPTPQEVVPTSNVAKLVQKYQPAQAQTAASTTSKPRPSSQKAFQTIAAAPPPVVIITTSQSSREKTQQQQNVQSASMWISLKPSTQRKQQQQPQQTNQSVTSNQTSPWVSPRPPTQKLQQPQSNQQPQQQQQQQQPTPQTSSWISPRHPTQKQHQQQQQQQQQQVSQENQSTTSPRLVVRKASEGDTENNSNNVPKIQEKTQQPTQSTAPVVSPKLDNISPVSQSQRWNSFTRGGHGNTSHSPAPARKSTLLMSSSRIGIDASKSISPDTLSASDSPMIPCIDNDPAMNTGTADKGSNTASGWKTYHGRSGRNTLVIPTK